MTVASKCSKHIVKENLLLQRDLAEPYRTAYTSIRLYIDKNVYIDRLHEIVDKCNNTFHWAIKVKPSCVMSGTYIDCDVEHNDKYPKLKIGDQVRISKYKHMK